MLQDSNPRRLDFRAGPTFETAVQAVQQRYEWLAELGQLDVALQSAQHESPSARGRELFSRLEQLEERLGFQ